jgi:hypothetical protein
LAGESVFFVKADSAEPLFRTTLQAEGLLERDHLQQWALQRPELLGEDLYVITNEFDRWEDASGQAVGDRLDVLALDPEGRPVVVELKRCPAPRLTYIQAIGYAAMVSRFTVDDLVEAHTSFLARIGKPTEPDEVRAILSGHAGGKKLSDHLLRSPAIVIIAESFAPAITSSVVWLSEQGVDITLRELQLYRSGADLLLTVSQTWPVRDVEEFTVKPRRQDADAVREERTLPSLPWTAEDLEALMLRVMGTKQEPTVLAMLDLAASNEDRWVGFEDLVTCSGKIRTQVQSDLAHLTRFANVDFGRENWPLSAQRREGKLGYLMDEPTAEAWRQVRRRQPSLPGDERSQDRAQPEGAPPANNDSR